MEREDFGDLIAFIAVAQEGSFTKAAAKLGVSQPALSHRMRALEERLGLRLLTRTTRSVSPTEAGQRLLTHVGPHFEQIEAEMASLGELRDKPSGTLRITALDHAADTILLPKLARMLADYPDVKVELNTDYQMVDIVERRFDAGVRLGEQVAKDMIAVRIGPDMRMALVASPSYFSRRPPPASPHELVSHACINVRLPTHGGLYVWEFEKDGSPLNVRVDGQLVVNGLSQVVTAALQGLGLAFTLDDMVREHVAAGRLVRVLDDWCPAFAGYHLYYPSRRQASPAFALLVDALRYKE
jgi:DNA-binding transcriptional LysR family regulator